MLRLHVLLHFQIHSHWMSARNRYCFDFPRGFSVSLRGIFVELLVFRCSIDILSRAREFLHLARGKNDLETVDVIETLPP